MAENTNTPKPELPKSRRPTPNPKRVRRITPALKRTALGRFFNWLRTPEHKWEFGIKVVTLAVAVVGTILLLNQNSLLKSQNSFIQQQMSLEEANRRGALVMLMSNIMDKVDDEIKEQKSEFRKVGISKAAVDTMKYSLSRSLIGQIAALSHSFKPYRFMKGDSLIREPLSPERGQLLITLTLLPLDTLALQKVYKSAAFYYADLVFANLSGADLRGANLRGAKLSGADLSGAKLSGAKLSGAELSWAELSGAELWGAELIGANLRWAGFSNADLRGAELSGAELWGANLRGANLRGANLRGANLSNADLSNADLSGAKYLSVKQATEVKSFSQSIGLHDSIKTELMKTHPTLFKEPKE